MFGAQMMWWLAVMPEGISTGFTSSVMLLRHCLFLMKSVLEYQIFTKVWGALLMVIRERQAAESCTHVTGGSCKR